MHTPESVLENEIHSILRHFEIQTDLPIIDRKPNPEIVTKNKEPCRSGRPLSKTQRKRKEKYLLESCKSTRPKLWNMKMIVIIIIVGALVTNPKVLMKSLEELDIGGRAEAIKMTTLMKSARILRRVQET